MKKVYLVNWDVAINSMFKIRKDEYELLGTNHKDADILVFDGGPDVSPELYGEKRLSCTGSDRRKEQHNKFFFESYPEKLKVGICFGGQYLNVMSGGAMWQNVNNHGRNHHMTNLLNINDKFKKGQDILVTSTHHQMMIPSKEGEILAFANEATEFLSASKRPNPDYDTEVVWYDKTKSLCFQPHPEYSSEAAMSTREYFFDLLKYLVE